MKIVLFLFTLGLFLGNEATAQTALIAHKSHSGTAVSFAIADPGNFGNPPASIAKVTRLNDTTVITEMDSWGNHRRDTVINSPVFSNPGISVDSMRKSMGWYGERIEFENFDSIHASSKQQTIQQTAVPAKASVLPVQQKNVKKKKRSGSAIWLWIIGGGTFLGIRLLSSVSARKSKPVHA